MFKQPSNYFLAIAFDWKDIFKIFEVPEKEQSNFVINEKYHYQSVNANSESGPIDETWACFEYYIMPNSLRNGSYSYSSIYDQQLKRFFESPNINYGFVLKNSKEEYSGFTCHFSKGTTYNKDCRKASFSISFSENSKSLVFLFDETYLDFQHTHSLGGNIPFETYEISFDKKNGEVVKKISIDPNTISIGISGQSVEDAQSSPFSQTLYKYFKNL